MGQRLEKPTIADLILSSILPGWGVVVGAVALCKGEGRRANIMITAGACLILILVVVFEFLLPVWGTVPSANESAAEERLLRVLVAEEVMRLKEARWRGGSLNTSGHYYAGLPELAREKLIDDDRVTMNGYKFVVNINASGFTCTADPIIPHVTGTKRYYLDQSQVMRYTADSSAATVQSDRVDWVELPHEAKMLLKKMGSSVY